MRHVHETAPAVNEGREPESTSKPTLALAADESNPSTRLIYTVGEVLSMTLLRHETLREGLIRLATDDAESFLRRYDNDGFDEATIIPTIELDGEGVTVTLTVARRPAT